MKPCMTKSATHLFASET